MLPASHLGTKRFCSVMRDSGGGSIINISSICGLVGSFGNAAYHASKGAVRIFTKATAVQHAKDNVRANSIHPGFVDTPMTAPGHSNNEVAKVRIEATPPWAIWCSQRYCHGLFIFGF